MLKVYHQNCFSLGFTGMIILLEILTFPNDLAFRTQDGGGQRPERYQ